MSPQRYERISGGDQNESFVSLHSRHSSDTVHASPPPSFRSRASSPASRRLLSQDPATSEAEQTLNDTFDDGSQSDDNGDGTDDRQRLMRHSTANTSPPSTPRPVESLDRPGVQRSVTRFPGASQPTADSSARPPQRTPLAYASQLNDGVFANLNAKPELGEKDEDQPPTYEAAAADATPPYWETTILAPGNFTSPDEVYIDGLPVGSLFSFIWNGMISVSFQLVGFLLTYLLHTTHAAKNGSLAGLGITLVQYGFYMRAGSGRSSSSSPVPPGAENPTFAPPADPNNHNLDMTQMQSQPDSPGAAAAAAAAAMTQATAAASTSIPSAPDGSTGGASGGVDWLAYAVMIIGWFILIRAASDYVRVRRHEMLVLQSPERNSQSNANSGRNAEDIIVPSLSSNMGVPILVSGPTPASDTAGTRTERERYEGENMV